MRNFTKIVQFNLIFSTLFIAIAFIYPIFNEEFFYKNKRREAETVAKLIANVEDDNFLNKNVYIPVQKGDTTTLKNRFNIRADDLKHYSFSVTTYLNRYEIVAEPKIEFLKSREIAPQIFIYSKQSDKSESKEWK